MNATDRVRLIRLQGILEAVPFSASGTATSTGYGAIMYEEDMRALLPYVRTIFESMVLETWAQELDLPDPDDILDLIELWVQQRKAVGWEDASRYSLERLHKATKE